MTSSIMPRHTPPVVTRAALVAMAMPHEPGSKAERIRCLNDAFRRTFIGGRVMLTAGVAALPEGGLHALLGAVQAFDRFDPGNDPHGDHDFGAVEHEGDRYFWKIDAYDTDLEFGSPDPSDPAGTTRVITVMRADEY